ncbi:MAG: spheroidene monooxygenase [Actinomycetota bacterium]
MTTKVYFWKIPSKQILWAILRMALDRRTLKRNSSITFWKLLGTGKGETFTPRDADPRRWGLLINIEEDALAEFENSRLIKRWNERSIDRFEATLKPIAVHGKWSKKSPFKSEIAPIDWSGKVVAITRARIKWRKNFLFWRSVPSVTKSLKSAPGLISAIGIGEAPLGLQGTFSIWEDPKTISYFAYRGQAHKEVIAATAREKWYAEELFGRFALINSSGAL